MESRDDQFSSDEILAEIRRSVQTRDVVDVEEDQVKIVVFRTGGHIYAFAGKVVLEILSGREIYPVPFLPEYIPGLINVRGDIEAAFDICCFLGGRKIDAAKGLIVMVQHEMFRSGVIVESIEDVLDVPLSSMDAPLPTLSGLLRELVSGSVEFSGRSVAVLDIGKVAARITQ